LTLLPEDSHARISRSPVSKPGSRVVVQDSGQSSPVLLAKYDPDSRSWRTSQCSLLESEGDGFSVFSETWPRSGLMRNGIAYQLQPLVRLTKGIASGLLPTPSAQEAGEIDPENIEGELKPNSRVYLKSSGRHAQITLNRYVKLWPTPHGMSKDGKSNGPSGNELGRAVNQSLLPTPAARDWKDGGYPSEFERHSPGLAAHAGGSLNPMWVEWLMGFPLGWTALKDSETRSCQPSQKSFSER
jgi:hypothetical protein